MRRSIAHLGVGALVLGGLTVGFAPSAAAQGEVVVATGLDNPRQLSWGDDGVLLVAEAGSGGDTCVTPPGAPPESGLCGGSTGGITAIEDPGGGGGTAERVVDGLFSLAGPDGSFAIGSNGADDTDLDGEYLVAEGNFPFGPLAPELLAAAGADTLAHLVVVEPDGEQQLVVPYAALAAAETELNPDGAQDESTAYAVLFVDPTPDGPAGEDGYALVADAAANTVWQVEPDVAAVPENCVGDACIPPYAITVFATFPTPAGDDVTPEYVPTSLATDDDGNVYVGGLGSEVAGAAEVRTYGPDGEELEAWSGFTAITGLAVDGAGEHLYVSQLFGSNPSAAPAGVPGNVVNVDVAAGTYRSVDVPFPGGVAVSADAEVYVSAYSVAPAEGIAETPMSPATPGGEVWRIDFADSADAGLPVPFPQDTGGEGAPAQAFLIALPDLCGGVFLSSGDLTGEWRVTRDDDGDRIEYRGATTVDVLSPDGTVLLDELDVSGEGSEFFGADGTWEYDFAAPSFVFASPAEVDAFAAAGLPANSYFTSGSITKTVSADDVVELISVPTDAVDFCSLLPVA
ncbi:ScyD/ScyE family protein [Modestobacter marinus]|uniref:ScyD/ScyE family protein n=1 Tax=Modestobacter marinus TaxID=477641 RepID=UPI001C9668BB|nr:ScyD/ScyE family protein [Modestobacter marinus]